MKGSKYLVLCGLVVAAMAMPASAVVVFDVQANPGAWQAALDASGKVLKDTTDFGLDPDYGIVGFSGPITSAGAGPVQPGTVADNWSIDAVLYQAPSTGLVGVGPSAGFGNPKNAILANYFVDSIQIDTTIGDTNETAVEINVLALLGGPTVNVRVDTNLGSTTFPGLAAPAATHNWGFLAEPGEIITGINIFDPGNGAEGFTMAMAYSPEPGCLALVALGGLAAIRRRR